LKDKKLNMLGLAMKAGKVSSGEEMVLESVKAGKAHLVIIAADASDNTKKLFHDKCGYYDVPVIEYGTKTELGWAIGKAERSSIAIEDKGIAEVLY
jgi:ribosomal protein L7Ae-like RNA K-turn-binding protein